MEMNEHHHYLSNSLPLPLSLFAHPWPHPPWPRPPVLGPALRSCPLCPSPDAAVARFSLVCPPSFSCYSSPLLSSPTSLFSPLLSLLSLSLHRTPNASSNGNPGYESLPLIDRQSPPPSVSSSVSVVSLCGLCDIFMCLYL